MADFSCAGGKFGVFVILQLEKHADIGRGNSNRGSTRDKKG